MGSVQPLPFRIDFQSQPGALRAHVTGVKGSIDITMAYWKAIAEEVRRQRPRTLLVVDALEGEALQAEFMPAFIDAMAGLGFEGVRIAFVETQGGQIPHVESAEILAREQVFEVRVCASETDASMWLRYGGH